jgi:hypothetical protein
MRRFSLLWFVAAFAIGISSSRADEAVADAYGVPVTQRDIDLHEAVGICAAHPTSDASLWPEPCTTANRQYEDTGAKKKYDLAASNLRSMHIQSVTKAIGK